MRRFVVLLVCLVFATCPLLSTAEEIITRETLNDMFKDISTDNLLLLRKLIALELEYRGYTDDATEPQEMKVPSGTYEIGVDIPAGTYTISTSGKIGTIITFYDEHGSIDTFHTILPSSPIGKCELKDGCTIAIQGEPVVIAPYAGLGFN